MYNVFFYVLFRFYIKNPLLNLINKGFYFNNNKFNYVPTVMVSITVLKAPSKKFAGTGSCPDNSIVYPDISPKAVPVTIVPPVTSIP